MKTRFWESEGSSTAVQYRDDMPRHVWFHTNIGWFATAFETEEEAEELAKGYGLTEASLEHARYMAGIEE